MHWPKANGKQDVTVHGELLPRQRHQCRYAFSRASRSPIFNRNQGEIARTRFAITKSQEQQAFTNGQVLTDVKDAYEGLQIQRQSGATLYTGTNIWTSRRSRATSAEYAYHRGGLALLDFLDAERSYRADGTWLSADAGFLLACARAASRSRGRQEFAVIRMGFHLRRRN